MSLNNLKCPVCMERLMEVPSGQTCPNGCIGIMPFQTTAVKGKRNYTLSRSRKPLPNQMKMFDLYDNTGGHDG